MPAVDVPMSRQDSPWLHRSFTGLLAITVALGIIYFVLSYLTFYYWSGSFSLTVKVNSIEPIEFLSYATTFDRETADLVAKDSSGQYDLGWEPAELERGKFTARVRCSGSGNYFNRDISFQQDSFIVLRYSGPDGTSTRKLAEIPRGRGPRSIEVVLP